MISGRCRLKVLSADCKIVRRNPVAFNARRRVFERGICTSITARNVAEAKKRALRAEEARANTIEFRLDFLDNFSAPKDLTELIECTRLPSIVTYRPDWEGGHYSGDETRRLDVLREAAKSGASFVDVELKAADSFFSRYTKGGGAEIILSHHDFDKTDSIAELSQVMDDMRDKGADVAKLACFCNDITDCVPLIKLLEQQTGPAIVLGMGEKGLMTRILAPKFGGFLTFGALEEGSESAPGQPTIKSMRDIYRVQEIKPATKLYGVVGNPIAHSKSPLFHNLCFEGIGYDGVYLPLLVDDFEKFIQSFEDLDFSGLSVTVPHKEAALFAADAVDDVTREIGACNTLVRQEDESLYGTNTDWSAAIDIIENSLESTGNGSLSGKTMVVVGAGGVSKALAYGGASRGAKIIIANRTIEKAEKLSSQIPDSTVVTLESLQRGDVKADVLANGTSLGMDPDIGSTPVPKKALKEFGLVFDAVYVPEETRLLREAAESGCRTASGIGMFVGQAKKQFSLFTGRDAPSHAVESFNLKRL